MIILTLIACDSGKSLVDSSVPSARSHIDGNIILWSTLKLLAARRRRNAVPTAVTRAIASGIWNRTWRGFMREYKRQMTNHIIDYIIDWLCFTIRIFALMIFNKIVVYVTQIWEIVTYMELVQIIICILLNGVLKSHPWKQEHSSSEYPYFPFNYLEWNFIFLFYLMSWLFNILFYHFL